MADEMIRIQLMGRPRVMIGDLELGGAAARPKAILFLACLALAGAEGVPRTRLKRLFWPTSDPEAARVSLKQLLYLLRKETGKPDLFVANGTVALNAEITQIDVWELTSALGEGDVARALALFQTGLVRGISTNVTALASWLAEERQVLRERIDAALSMALTGDRIRLDGAEAIDLWIQGTNHGFDVSRSAPALIGWIASDAGCGLRPRLPELTQAALRIEQQHEGAAGTAAEFQRVAISCGAAAATMAQIPKEVPSPASVRPRPMRRRIMQTVVAIASASLAMAAIGPVHRAIVYRWQRHTVIVDRFDCAGPSGRRAGDPWLAVMTAEALRSANEPTVHVTVGGDPGSSDYRVTATCAAVAGKTELRFTLERGAKHQVVRTLMPVMVADPAADIARAVDRLVGAVGIEVDPELAIWKGSMAGDADLTAWRLLALELADETDSTGLLSHVGSHRAMAHDSSSPIVRLVATGFAGLPNASEALGRCANLASEYSELRPDQLRPLFSATERLYGGTHWATDLGWKATNRTGWLGARYDSLTHSQQKWIAQLAAAATERAQAMNDSTLTLYQVLVGLQEAANVGGNCAGVSVTANENFTWLQSRKDSLPPMVRSWVDLATGYPLADSVTTLLDFARRVLKMIPALPAARRWITEAYLMAGLPDSAMAVLDRNRATLTPMNDRPEITLEFETLMAGGRFEQALRLIDKRINDQPTPTFWRRVGEALHLVKQMAGDSAGRPWQGKRSWEGGPMVDIFFVVDRARALRAIGRTEEARLTLNDQLVQLEGDSRYRAGMLLGSPVSLPGLERVDSIAARELRGRREEFHRKSYWDLGQATGWASLTRSFWQLSRQLEDDPRRLDFTLASDRYVVQLLESGDARAACMELDSANTFLRSQIEYKVLALNVRAACGDQPGFVRAEIALRNAAWPGRPGLIDYYQALSLAAAGKCDFASVSLEAAFKNGLPFQPSRFRLPEWEPCRRDQGLAKVIPSKEFGAPN